MVLIMDDKEIEGQEKLQRLWNDSKRYQKTQEEVRKALRTSKVLSGSTPFYRHRYFAIAASIVILVGIAGGLFFILQKPISDTRNNDLTHDKDTTLKLHIEKPDAKASQEIYQDETLLQWTRRYDTISHLVIIDVREGKIVFQTELQPLQQSFHLPKNTLKPGEYSWYVGDKKQTKKLIIVH
jgi:hypothetical protein